MINLGRRWLGALVICMLGVGAMSATADPPEAAGALAPTAAAAARASRRRAQLAAPVANAAAALAAVRKATRARPDRAWKEFSSKEGRFGVTFPGTPKERSATSDAASELGRAVDYELALAPDEVYVAGYATIRKLETSMDAALEDALHGAAEQLHGTLKDEVRQVSGPPAIQGRITLPDGAVIVVEFVAIDDMFYGLAAGDRSGIGLDNAERFLASFAPASRPTSADPSGEDDTAIYGGLIGTESGSDWVRDPGGGGLGMTIGGDRRNTHDAIVELGRPAITGSLDAVWIRRYIKRHIEELRYCYQKQLVAKPHLAGSIKAEFTVAADGTVSSSKAIGVEPAVASCFATVIGNISFRKTVRGGTVKYPFQLRASR